MFQIRGVHGARLQRHFPQSVVNVAVPWCAQPIPRISEIAAHEEFHTSRLRLRDLRIPIVSRLLEALGRAPKGWIVKVVLVIRFRSNL